MRQPLFYDNLVNFKFSPEQIVVGVALSYGAGSDLLEGIGVYDIVDRAVTAGEGGIESECVVEQVRSENTKFAEIRGVEVTREDHIVIL